MEAGLQTILLDRSRESLDQSFGNSKTALEDLMHYRRSVGEIYNRIRQGSSNPLESWRLFRSERDKLFATHPQSALSYEQKKRFKGLDYYSYNPALRFLVNIDPDVDPKLFEVPLQNDGTMQMKRFGKIHFLVAGREVSLSIFWIMGYGGGVFLPFRDETNHDKTYGGGRYLLDTIKQVDLGQEGSRLVVDFNFAYNPSCAYNSRWHCPLAPSENWLPVPIRGGEKKFADPI